MVSITTMSISFPSVATAIIVGVPPPPPAATYLVRFFRTINTQNALKSALRFCPAKCSHTSTNESSDFDISSSIEKQGFNGTTGKEEKDQETSINKTLMMLRRYGISGVLSYGLLNTAYYLTTFLVVWFYAAPAPGKMGYLAAVERFLKVMAMVWAGSQVTKILRAGGALALAPFVDRGLSWFTIKFGFKSQGKAFAVIAGLCFGLAFLVFLILTLLWA